MYSNGSTAQFPAVQDQVVGPRTDLQRIGLDQVHVVGMRHRERMVGRLKVAVLVDTFEQRELRDPDVLMRSLADRGEPSVVRIAPRT